MSRTLPQSSPAWVAWIPWTDRRGRFDNLRAVTFGLLLLPALWVLVRYPAGMLGARPLTTAIHSTGFWAVMWIVASLMITPAKAIFGLPHIVVLRRMIGNAAAAYAGLHLVLYCTDQNWQIVTIVSEIIKRFYLTIGFVSLLGLAALAFTSTDNAVRRMGTKWKRLHKLVYAIATLSLVHFILQTKADVSLPLLFVGVFVWLMLWRQMPAGQDRTMGGLLLVAAATALVTLAAEWLWYRFGTHIDPTKMVLAETDVSFGLGPADQAALAGLGVLASLALRRLSQGTLGTRAWFWVTLFALGAVINELVVFVFGIDRFIDPGDYTFVYQDVAWAALLGVLGFLHWRLRGTSRASEVDALALCCIAFEIMLSASSLRAAEIVAAAAIALLWAVVAWQSWRETKLAALSWVPLGLVMAYGVATQM